MATKVLSCDCTSLQSFKVKAAGVHPEASRWAVPVPFHTREAGAQFQDRRYGKGMRLHNVNRKGDAAVCTVCAKRRSV